MKNKKLISRKRNSKLIPIISIIFIVLSVGALFLFHTTNANKTVPINKEYQGPVRPGDDEQYFRQTGITRPLGVKG